MTGFPRWKPAPSKFQKAERFVFSRFVAKNFAVTHFCAAHFSSSVRLQVREHHLLPSGDVLAVPLHRGLFRFIEDGEPATYALTFTFKVGEAKGYTTLAKQGKKNQRWLTKEYDHTLHYVRLVEGGAAQLSLWL